MSHILVSAFKNSNTPFTLFVWEVTSSGTREAFLLDTATKIEVVLKGANAGADVILNSDDGKVSFSGNSIVVDIGSTTIDMGEYQSTIKVFDTAHTLGQYIAHPDHKNRLTIRVGE